MGGLAQIVAAPAFGFAFIHPFKDGNGRLHRWLVHHTLGRLRFNPPGVIFPASAVPLERVAEYRNVLRALFAVAFGTHAMGDVPRAERACR